MKCPGCGADPRPRIGLRCPPAYCSVACRSRAGYLRRADAAKAFAKAVYYAKYDDYDEKRNTAAGKYTRQVRRAAERGIGWGFTYESWLAWWGDDIARRGCRKGQLVMARRGDAGPYSETNCIKITCSENVASAHRKVVH